MNISSFLELSSKRYSCRAYLDQPVPDDMIENCLEAARLAPSACNKQPWRFIVVKDKEKRKRIQAEGLLPGIPMPWLADAPVIIALCAEQTTVTHKLAPLLSGVKYHLIDIGIAGEHFVLAAAAQNLGTCWIGWFREKPVKKILNIPKNIQVLSLISLGYPKPDATHSHPERKTIDSIVHHEEW